MPKNLREEAFSKELKLFKKNLLIHKNTTITGISDVGCRSMVRLLAKDVITNYDHIIYDDNFISFTEIRNKLEVLDGKVLLVIPEYSKHDIDFQINFQKLLQGSFKKINTLIGINLPYYLNLSEVFNISTKPISKVEILTTRDKEETFLLLNEYFDELQAEEYLERIYKLSGGIPGLIKRISYMYLSESLTTNNELIEEPVIRINLDKIKVEYSSLNFQQRLEFGLVDNNGNVKSELLKDFLDIVEVEDETLVAKLLKIFEVKLNEIVSINTIDDFISKNGEFSLWNRYKLIQRVRGKLTHERKLVTIRNKGYKLIGA